MRHYHILVLFLVLLFSSPISLAAWKENTKAPKQAEVLIKIEKLVGRVGAPVVIFDLDSTLYKNHNRWAVIVQEFGQEKGIPNLTNFKKEQITDSFDMKRVLKDDAKLDEKLVKKILPEFKNYWGKRFFHNDYMKYDKPLPGAVAYVKKLHKLGAQIVYITGRDEPNMKIGTAAKLKADGFPLGVERTLLIMKPKSNSDLKDQAKNEKEYAELLKLSDKEFKKSAISKAQAFGNVVASFDNEPHHINIYFKAFHRLGNGYAIFLDTDHSKNPPPLEKGIVSVNGFLH